MKLFLAYLNYTVIPLRMATIMGTLFSFVGLIGAIAVLVQKIMDPTVIIGWSSLMCTLLMLFGITFLMLGIIGEYLGKIILNINRTPQYVIRETVNIKKEEIETDTEKQNKG